MKVADYISQLLSDAGLDTVFMITGGGAMHLNDAFARNKHLKTYYFHHEQSLSIAAEGFARLKNKPAIVNVTTGPGGINALNGVFGAYVDSIPMVIISGQVKRETTLSSTHIPLRQLGDQEAPIHEIAKPMVKYMRVLEKAEDVGQALSEALHVCLNGRPGPVWIDIPGDIQSSQINVS
jgi:acetolactate synthase-1/2/3 large subunit